APLARHLQALPAEQASVTLTFAAVEAIVGDTLLLGARTPGFWTGNGSMMRQLRRSGWRVTLGAGRDDATCFRLAADSLLPPRLDYPAILAAYAAGERVAAVAQRLALSSGSVYYVLRRAG